MCLLLAEAVVVEEILQEVEVLVDCVIQQDIQ
jgi:hypothetical protein